MDRKASPSSRLICVSWIDSSTEHGWSSVSSVSFDSGLCFSTGFFLKENKEFLVLAHSVDEESGTCNGVLQIPQVAILFRGEVLWPKEKRKKN